MFSSSRARRMPSTLPWAGSTASSVPTSVRSAQPAVQRRAPGRLPGVAEPFLGLLGPDLLQAVEPAVEERGVRRRAAQREITEPLSGQDGVLVLPQRFLDRLH